MISTFPPAASFRPFRPSFSLVIAGFAAALALGLEGCHQTVKDPNDPRFVEAEAKDWTITRAQLTDEVATFLKQRGKTVHDVDPAKMPMLESEILNNMAIKKLILAKAATLPLKDVDKDDAAELAHIKSEAPSPADLDAKLKSAGLTMDSFKQQIHESTLMRKTVEMEAFKDIQPTDAEINTFYLQNQDKLTTPQKVRASRIIIMADDKTSPADKKAKMKAIDKAHARVLKGEDFAKVATEVSEDRYSASKGGDLGYFQKGENEANFDTVAFATKPGVVSPVFETPMGYEFLKVTDEHPAGVVSIAEARDTISRYLLQQKQRQAMDSYAKKLLADSGVVIHLVKVDPAQLPGANSASPAPDAQAPAPAANQPPK